MTDNEELVGKINFVSLFPQYLSCAMLARYCMRVKRIINALDASNIHWGGGGSLVDTHAEDKISEKATQNSAVFVGRWGYTRAVWYENKVVRFQNALLEPVRVDAHKAI